MNKMNPFTDVSVSITQEEIDVRKSYLGLSAEEEAEVMRFYPAVVAMAPVVVHDFYADLLELEVFKAAVETPGMKSRMEQTMVQYIRALFSGCYDVAYAEERLRIGHIHVHLGVPASQLIASLFRLRIQIANRLMATGLLPHIPISMAKVFLLDTQFIVDAYCER